MLNTDFVHVLYSNRLNCWRIYRVAQKVSHYQMIKKSY